MSKILNLENLTLYNDLIKQYIGTEDKKSIKSVIFDDSTRTVKFYKTETTTGAPDYSVILPADVDISGLIPKISNGTTGNVATVASGGGVSDSGTALSTLAVKSEVQAVDTKIGTIANLETTAKEDLVTAINEVRNAISAGGTEAAVTMTSTTTTSGMLKSYTIKQGSNTVGVIDIPKDFVVSSGTVVTDPTGQPAGTYIKLVIANQTDPLYINVGTLVDLYTATADAAQVQITVDNSTRKISAAVVAGSISATELAANAVTTAKIANGNVTLEKLGTDVTSKFTTLETAIGNVATEDDINALF